MANAINSAHGDLWDPAISANSEVHNGGSVLMGGNVSSSGPIANAPNLTILGAGRKAQPTVQQSAYTGAVISNALGNFATMTAGKYVMVGGNITTTLAGVAYTGLAGGANPIQHNSIHTGLTRKSIIITSWNYATGVATIDSVSDDDFDINGTYAAPTRAVPGNLVFIEDGKNVETTAYSAKTG